MAEVSSSVLSSEAPIASLIEQSSEMVAAVTSEPIELFSSEVAISAVSAAKTIVSKTDNRNHTSDTEEENADNTSAATSQDIKPHFDQEQLDYVKNAVCSLCGEHDCPAMGYAYMDRVAYGVIEYMRKCPLYGIATCKNCGKTILVYSEAHKIDIGDNHMKYCFGNCQPTE